MPILDSYNCQQAYRDGLHWLIWDRPGIEEPTAIVIIIGLLQVQGTVHMRPERIVRRADLILGFLEILLGIVVLAASIDVGCILEAVSSTDVGYSTGTEIR